MTWRIAKGSNPTTSQPDRLGTTAPASQRHRPIALSVMSNTDDLDLVAAVRAPVTV